MNCARIYSTPDGESDFEDLDLELAPVVFVPGQKAILLSPALATKSIIFFELPPGWEVELHPTPSRQYVVNFSGAMEIVNSRGTGRVFGPGACFLVDDTTGKGHSARVVGDEPCTGIFVAVAE